MDLAAGSGEGMQDELPEPAKQVPVHKLLDQQHGSMLGSISLTGPGIQSHIWGHVAK